MSTTSWRSTENMIVSSKTANYATWYITLTIPDITVSGSTFTLTQPTATAYHDAGTAPSGSSSVSNNAGLVFIPLMLCKANDTARWTTPSELWEGHSVIDTSSAFWPKNTSKTLRLANSHTLPTISTSDVFNDDNPTTRSVSLLDIDYQWIIMAQNKGSTWTDGDGHPHDYKYYVASYYWNGSKVTHGGKTEVSANSGQNRVVTGLNQPTITLNAPPIVNGYPEKDSYSYGDTIEVSYDASAQYGGSITKVTCTINGISKTSSSDSDTLSWSNFQSSGSFPISITATDSRGQTTTKSLGSITVTQRRKPTISVNTGGVSTFEYGSNISVNVAAEAYDGATVSRIRVYVGDVYKDVNAPGTVIFTNYTSVGQKAVTATVTDTAGGTATASGSTITVLAAKPPSFDVTDPAGGSYDAGTRYTVVVSNVQTYQSSTVRSIVLAVGSESTTSQVGGTIYVTLPASGSYTPTVTVTDSDGRATTKSLNPISIRNSAIYVASLDAERIDLTNDLPADDGTAALLTASFVVQAGTLRLPTVTATDADGTSTQVAAAWYYNYSRTTGFSNSISDWSTVQSGTTVFAKVYGTQGVFPANKTFAISVMPISSVEQGTRVIVYLAQEFFLLAGRRGGRALGIGQKPSADNLFEVVMESRFLSGAASFFVKTNDNQMVSLIDLIYPVYSYYETSRPQSEFDPNDYWGGTWHLTAEPGKYIWHRTQ